MGECLQLRNTQRSRDDIVFLINSITKPGDRIVVVEVGSYAGASAHIMLDTGRVKKIYCVDPWKGGYDDEDKTSHSDYSVVEAEFDRTVGSDSRIVKFKGTLSEFVSARKADVSFGDSVDLVYLDACLMYDAVVSDIRLSLEELKPSRALAGHDYTRKSVRNAVIDTLGRPESFLMESWVHPTLASSHGSIASDFKSTGTRFDIVSVLLFTNGNDRYRLRESAVMRELESVGIHAEPFRHVGTRYDGLVEQSVVHDSFVQGGVLNSVLGHLHMIKSAYSRGAETALFFEDDIRFLKDRNLLKQVVDNLPPDFDIALFDWFYPQHMNAEARRNVLKDKVNEHWIRFTDLRSAAAYALSRTAMGRLITLLERAAVDSGKMKTSDQFYWDVILAKDIKAYAAVPNACAQVLSGNSSYTRMLNDYGDAGVDLRQYGDSGLPSSDIGNVVPWHGQTRPLEIRTVDVHSGHTSVCPKNGSPVGHPCPCLTVDRCPCPAFSSLQKPGLCPCGLLEKRYTDTAGQEPVDAVFIIGTGSQNNNEELRYALRNVERNCPFVRNVFISGECPDWIDRESVIHLQWPDRFHHAKDANIVDKLRHACEDSRIARRVLFCSDDQFQTRVCTWEDFSPVWLRRYDRNDRWYIERKRDWHTRLWKTLERERLRRIEAGLDPSDVYYWEPHIYSPLDRDLFLRFARWSDYKHLDGAITQTAYYNYVGQRGVPSFDHLFIPNTGSWRPDKTHIAYMDESFESAMTYLRKTFPNKSRFER